MSLSPTDEQEMACLQLLRTVFSHQEFRGLQWPVIRALRQGASALAVFPTGAGKSLCYQLPACMDDGLTLVISPLIALMNDQKHALVARGIAAEKLDSTLSLEDSEHVIEQIRSNQLRILFLSPERLAQRSMQVMLRQVTIATLVIDEAHCISEWGHNFRPDYLKIARSARRLGVGKILALTATATREVKRDIARAFRIHSSHVYETPPTRPNLRLIVHSCMPLEKDALLLESLRNTKGSTIVYAATRRDTERLTSLLHQEKISARAYHAGLPIDTRNSAQNLFMSNQVRVIVATIAFGMGIDKPDIRHIIHYHLPKCLEGYSQETGRAGRDGLPATCEMFAAHDDTRILENHIFASTPTANGLRKLIDHILRYAIPGKDFSHSTYDLSLTHDLREETISSVLALLDLHQVIEPRGSYHCHYRVKLLRPLESVLAGRPRKEKSLVKTILESATPQYGILLIDLLAVAAATKTKRDTIATLLGELEKANDLRVDQRGLRIVYRLHPCWDGDIHALHQRLASSFQSRETYEHARIARVVSFVNSRICRARQLSSYFGWKHTQPCGNCDNCLKTSGAKMKIIQAPRITDHQWENIRDLRDQNHPALATPHQLTRFLCGISSPASTRARLYSHPDFGIWQEHRFADILSMMQA
jgi:ATP-dependent DNA helicase RecQ